jgi:hypothetical protein
MPAFSDQALGDVFRRVTEQFSETVVSKVDGRGIVLYLNPFGLRPAGLNACAAGLAVGTEPGHRPAAGPQSRLRREPDEAR